jgi:hypothetical protein
MNSAVIKRAAMSTQQYTYADLVALSTTSVNNPLPQGTWKPALRCPPFIPLPTLINTRSLSLLPGSKIKPHRVIRSGTLHETSQVDITALRDDYGLVRIFDLRRAKDIEANVYSVNVPGVELEWIGEMDGQPEPMNLKRFDGKIVDGYLWMYPEFLKKYRTCFRRVFEFLRDTTEGGILIHCNGMLSLLHFQRFHAPSHMLLTTYRRQRSHRRSHRSYSESYRPFVYLDCPGL